MLWQILCNFHSLTLMTLEPLPTLINAFSYVLQTFQRIIVHIAPHSIYELNFASVKVLAWRLRRRHVMSADQRLAMFLRHNSAILLFLFKAFLQLLYWVLVITACFFCFLFYFCSHDLKMALKTELILSIAFFTFFLLISENLIDFSALVILKSIKFIST